MKSWSLSWVVLAIKSYYEVSLAGSNLNLDDFFASLNFLTLSMPLTIST